MLSHDSANALSSSLAPDQPIGTVKDDKFSRSGFVKSLAQALLNNDASHGLIVGFDAPWGYGKTSLKNMVVEQLGKDTDPNVTVVEFEPWMYSDTGDVVSALFRTIAQSLSGFGAGITALEVRHVFSVISDFFAGLFGAITPPDATVAMTSKVLSQGFKSLSKILEPNSGKIDKLRSVREKLRKDLLKEKRRIIVFIDDIDRLADDEISALFRAVKSVGDFPNVIYVLLYDHHKVAEALERDARSSGHEFLEKIVQVPILVPEPSGVVVRTKLKDDLISIRNNRSSDNILSPRDEHIFSNCISPFITTPRRANLLLNKVKLSYSTLGADIELFDLAGITCIEAFCPKLYQWISRHRHEICGGIPRGNASSGSLTSSSSSERITQLIQESDKNLTEECADWKHVVETLFPLVSWATVKQFAFLGKNETDQSYRSIYKDQYVDLYFNFNLPENVIPESLYSSFLLNKNINELDITPDSDYAKSAFSGAIQDYIERYVLKNKAIDTKQIIELFKFYCEVPFSMQYRSSEVSPPLMPTYPMKTFLRASLNKKSGLDTVSILDALVLLDSPGAFLALIWLTVGMKLCLMRKQTNDFRKNVFLNEMSNYGQDNINNFIDHNLSALGDEALKERLPHIIDKLKELAVKMQENGNLPANIWHIELLQAAAMLRWLFEDDADDLISSLRALEPYIDQEMYSVTIAAALTKREDKQYIVNRKILDRIVNPETYRKAILSIIKRDAQNIPEPEGQHVAYAALLKKEANEASDTVHTAVSVDEVLNLLEDWRRGKFASDSKG